MSGYIYPVRSRVHKQFKPNLSELARYFETSEKWEKRGIVHSELRDRVITANITKFKPLKHFAVRRVEKMFDDYIKNYVKYKDEDKAFFKTAMDYLKREINNYEVKDEIDLMVKYADDYLKITTDLDFVLKSKETELNVLKEVVSEYK